MRAREVPVKRQTVVAGAALLAACTAIGACSAENPDASVAPASPSPSTSTNPGINPRPEVPAMTDEPDWLACAEVGASAVLADETGEALARAAAVYTPTAEETKLIAAYWLLLVMATETDGVDPALLAPELWQRAFSVAERYLPTFDGCGAARGEVGSARLGLIDSERDFSCAAECIPSAGALKNSLKSILKDALGASQNPLAQVLSKALPLARKVSDWRISRIKSNQDVDADVAALLTEPEATGLVSEVVKVLKPAAEVASLGALLTGSAPLTAVAGALGIVVGAGTIWRELRQASTLIDQCEAWKEENCVDCYCSRSTITYGTSTPSYDCAEWTGMGPRAFCFAIIGSSNECCTCDELSRDKYVACSNSLSFDTDATELDYEACCVEAQAFTHAKSQPALFCPCGPPEEP
jgi:hypothetical protein